MLVTQTMAAAAFEADVFPATVECLGTHAQVVEFAHILWAPGLLRHLRRVCFNAISKVCSAEYEVESYEEAAIAGKKKS